MMPSVIVEAPAKLNLSLRVVRRRDDGFHEIDSVMVRLEGLADRISLEPSEEDAFVCEAPGVPTDGSNLVLRARDLFREETGMRQPLAIRLEKRVPHGAGLGGGSSDAAAVLAGLNALWEGRVPVETLQEWAARLGSDIPFFLGSPVARVTGRGEQLGPGPTVPSLRVMLLKPGFGVSTPDAYGRWKEALPLEGMDEAPQRFSWGELVNDLERPVFRKFLFLAEVKLWLLRQEGVEGALMSGSGSTMFAVLGEGADPEALAAAARAELDPQLWIWSGRTQAG
ncbi:4-diphosphocytidyl-2-C-methyl-D-erythritol kinase [Haloferula luteola]|uniref:4-diphosphocytidyl-2-C-methyl-D-erythritol kinase n=1 Tax=Haloferula luteola TaxID=595692 RepID=A0A840UWW7_9BACT|nr:4-(cytidine 5'-diphospho)-2-C-methyl-D-erythritol kinase [Haloferula luteola]MBB5350647.1 4-diphosphocytidyl-2-C-methyl-D-erythritol kinase [Haloferula luteola]